MNEASQKKAAVKSAILCFLGVLIFLVLFHIVFWDSIDVKSEEIWVFVRTWVYVISGFGILVTLMAILVYKLKLKKADSEMPRKSLINSGSRRFISVIFGVYLIVSSIVTVDQYPLKMSLFKIAFGAFAVLWGIFYKRNMPTLKN